MTIRTDFELAWHRSPRTARIFSPSVELTVQDAHDSLANLEDSEIGNLHSDLITSAGKENLGGGVEVGITSTLQNTQIMFDARTTPASSATVTTGDPNGEVLVDIGATFIADGVDRGFLIINFTDQSMATVLDVITETQLICTKLEGGADNQFDVSDDVKIYKMWEVELVGGNVVAVDDVGADIPALLPTFGVMPVRTSASSATTQNQEALEFALFQNQVTVDIISGVPGTTGLIGTPKEPVNNILDAVIIANNKGLHSLHINGNVTFDTGHDISEFHIEGESSIKSLITVNPGAIVNDAEFHECSLQGTLDTGVFVHDSVILDISFFEGFFHDCALTGTVILGGSRDTHIINCHDATAGGGAAIATIDMGGTGRGLIVRNFAGGLELKNKTGVDEVSVGIGRGRLVLDSTVTNGEILVRIGAGKLTDNSVGATVNSDEVMSPLTISTAVWEKLAADHVDPGTMGARSHLIEQLLRNRLETDPVTGKIQLFDDADVLLLEATVFEDVAGGTPYAGGPINRKDRLVVP